MYYLLGILSGVLGLDGLTYALVFAMTLVGTRILKSAIHNALLTLSFFPVLGLSAAIANFAAQSSGLTYPFDVPYDELGLIQHVPMEDFVAAFTVTFAGMLVGLAIVLGFYRLWGHLGAVVTRTT